MCPSWTQCHTGCKCSPASTYSADLCFEAEIIGFSGLYFFFNLSLTLYNKAVLASFPFPWSLTCMHSLCAAIGSFAAYKRGYFKRSSTLTARDQLVLVAYSSLYTVNIAVSNLSLNLVSVALHQVIRSTGPIFTILITLALFNKQYQLRTYLSLVPVIVGVGLAT